jgi:hypothetical protein
MIRSAISPRFAISILRSGGGSGGGGNEGGEDDDDGRLSSLLLGADAGVTVDAGADDEKNNDNDDDDWTNNRRKCDAAINEFREHCIFEEGADETGEVMEVSSSAATLLLPIDVLG